MFDYSLIQQVPILLAYVYGVVPISLCRSGGCGVTASNSGGVRFAFDEESGAVASDSNFYGYGSAAANNPSSSQSVAGVQAEKRRSAFKSGNVYTPLDNSIVLTGLSSVKVCTLLKKKVS